MAFKLYRGKTKMMHFRKTDTTLNSSLKDGSLVGLTDSGNLTSLANDTTDRVVGVCRLTIAATDTSSWPGAPLVPVQVPIENAVEWRVGTDTGAGAVDSDVGRYCAVDTQEASDSESTLVDISDTNERVFGITRIISGSEVVGVITKSFFGAQRQLQADSTNDSSIQ